MLQKCIDFIKAHFDFKLYGATIFALLSVVIIIPCAFLLPEEFGYKNGLIENLQLVVLVLMVILCAISKVNKRFFRFLIFVLAIIILREVNCFRTVFLAKPGLEDEFYSWKAIRYSYILSLTDFLGNNKVYEGTICMAPIIHGIFGSFIGIVALFFFIKKIWLDVWHIMQKIKFPFWNILIAALAMIIGLVADKLWESAVIEEGIELIFYISFAGIIWLYSRNKAFAVEVCE